MRYGTSQPVATSDMESLTNERTPLEHCSSSEGGIASLSALSVGRAADSRQISPVRRRLFAVGGMSHLQQEIQTGLCPNFG